MQEVSAEGNLVLIVRSTAEAISVLVPMGRNLSA